MKEQKKTPNSGYMPEAGDAVFHPHYGIGWRAHSTERRANTITCRYSDFRIILLAAPSHPFGQWHVAVFVPGYGGGSVTDFNRLP
jgi:hypothetical protein